MERDRVTPAESETVLRPLSVGEMLDRAVALCVKNFVPFALIYMVYAIPLGVVTYYATRDFARLMEVIAASVPTQSVPGHHASSVELQRQIGRLARPNVWLVLLGIGAFLISPLPAAALIDAVTGRYLGRKVSFGDAYRTALRRWLPLLGLNVMFGATAIALYLAVTIAVFAIVLVLTLVTSALHGFGIALDVVFGIASLAAIVGLATLTFLAFQVAYFSCVVENAGVLRAFARGFDRVALGAFWKRSLLVGIAYVAILIGILIVSSAGQAIVLGIVHSAVLAAAWATVVRLGTVAFTTAFIAVYYLDVRVRREGLDLQLAADALGPGALAIERS